MNSIKARRATASNNNPSGRADKSTSGRSKAKSTQRVTVETSKQLSNPLDTEIFLITDRYPRRFLIDCPDQYRHLLGLSERL